MFSSGQRTKIISLKIEPQIGLARNGKGSFLMKVDLVGGNREEVVVDSGAEENVCPWEWGEEFGVDRSGKKMVFRGANGAWINHFGERKVFVYSPFQRRGP